MKEKSGLACQLFLLICLSASAHAQSTDAARIGGRVVDASGGVLPQVSVVLLKKDVGFERRTQTDEEGGFAFDFLTPGTYTVSFELPGFATARCEDIRLLSYQRLEVPITLRVGAPETVVSVTSRSSQVDAASPTVREALPRTAIQEMPVLTGGTFRSVLSQLPLLFPGASSIQPTGRADAWGMDLSINGSGLGGVGFYFDGVDNSYVLGGAGGAVSTGPNPDALEELSVLSHNYKAESGGHQAQVHWRTRHGTEQVHGQARVFRLDPRWAARDFFATERAAGNTTTGAGFQLSGPLVIPRLYDGHNRTFWFFDTEWTGYEFKQATQSVFPSDAERSGDFSNLPPELWPVDPATGQVFPNGRLPGMRIIPQSRTYVDQFIPRDPTGGGVTTIARKRPFGAQFTTRLDHHLSGADALSGSLFLYREDTTSEDPTTVGTTGEEHWRDRILSVQYVRTISSRMSNAFTFGHTLQTGRSVQNGKLRDVDLTRNGYNIHNATSGPRGYPNAWMDTNWYSPAGHARRDYTSTFHWKDDFSLVQGANSWKFGADLRRTASQSYSSGAPTFVFSASNPSGSGNDFADFLLGVPVSFSQASDGVQRPERLLTALYAQDDVKIGSGLTLNIGLRYELNGALKERDNHTGVFRPGSQSSVFPNAPAGILFSGDFDPVLRRRMDGAPIPTDRNNLAPRIGLAWSPGFRDGLPRRLFGGPAQTSIRAGYGIYYIIGLALPITWMGNIQPWYTSVDRDRSRLDASGGTMADPWGTDPCPFAETFEQRAFFLPLLNVIQADPAFRDSYQHQWTLSVQRQIPSGTMFELAYVGSRGLHLMRRYEANPGMITPDANLSNVDSRRTYSDFGGVGGFSSDGTSEYHGFQATVSRRFSSRLMFNVHYVWSKTLDNAGGNLARWTADRATAPWGRANSDRTHNFVGYWVWDVPGLDKLQMIGQLLSGWRLSGNVQLRSGIPLNIRNPWDSTLRGFDPGMPDIAGAFERFDPRDIQTFRLPNGRTATGHFLFDPSVFRIVNPSDPEAARIGNLGRNVYSGPGTASVDLSLLKEFRLKERHRIGARVDVTNAFNHAQFVARPMTTNSINSIQFGRVSGTSGPRRIQIQLRYSF